MNSTSLRSMDLTEMSKQEMEAVNGGIFWLLAALIIAGAGLLGYGLGKSEWSR